MLGVRRLTDRITWIAAQTHLQHFRHLFVSKS